MTAATNRTALPPVQESMMEKNTCCWSTGCKRCKATQDTEKQHHLPPSSTCLIILDSQIDEILLMHPLSCECSCTDLLCKVNLGSHLVDHRHSPNKSSHTNHTHGMATWPHGMAIQVQGTPKLNESQESSETCVRRTHIASDSLLQTAHWVKLIKQRLPL